MTAPEIVHVAIWKKTGVQVVIRHRELSTTVEFPGGFVYDLAELGSIEDFDVLREV